MDAERKIHINEDHPLNAPGATKIYLNAGKSRNVDSPNDGTVITLNTDKQADLGVHLNTTFSIASSKKIRLLFLLNFLLSLVCMVICFCVACYYWQELSSLRRQLDTMKDHLLIQNLNQEKLALQNAIAKSQKPESREPRTFSISENSSSEDAKKFYVEDLGEDLLFVDSRKKNKTDFKHTASYLATTQRDIVITQFNGGDVERNMGHQSTTGPWVRDEEVSTKNGIDKIDLNQETYKFSIKESGLYLVYAQLTYLTHAPSCYLIWARKSNQIPRQLSMCATGDDSTGRPLLKAQLSCAVQTVARLQAGDNVTVQQRDANRTLILKPGYSYIGFVKLGP